jgi:hypothetical protein
MKQKYLSKILFFIYIFLINYCRNREITPLEEIFGNLTIELNKNFNPNKVIIIKNIYNFNITSVQPILRYSNYSLDNDYIKFIESKLILCFTSILYIPFNSKINYCNNGKQYKSISVNIIMKLNFSDIIFNRLEDNSYSANFNFDSDDYLKNVEMTFNYIEDYSFFLKNEITVEEKEKFSNLYFNKIKEYLINYPICDGIYILSLLKEYTLNQNFNIYLYRDNYYLFDQEITFFEYEKHVKVDNIKSQFLNVAIKLKYSFCTNYYYYYSNYCYEYSGECIINNITIFKNDIKLGQIQSGAFCSEDEKELIKDIFDESINFVIEYVDV